MKKKIIISSLLVLCFLFTVFTTEIFANNGYSKDETSTFQEGLLIKSNNKYLEEGEEIKIFNIEIRKEYINIELEARNKKLSIKT